MTSAWLAVALAALTGCSVSDATFVAGGSDGAVSTDFAVEIDLEHDLVQRGATEDGQLVAVQDGDGPFVAIAGDAGIYRTTIRSGRYGLVIGCRLMPTSSEVEIILGTAADGTTIHRPSCAARDRLAFVSGSVLDVAGGSVQVVSRRDSATIPAGTQFPSYMLQTVKGPSEVIATSMSPVDNILRVVRSMPIDLETSHGLDLDFAGALPITPQSVTGAPADAAITTALVTATGTYPLDQPPLLDSPASYHMLPASALRQGDLYLVTATVANAAATVVTAGDVVSLSLPDPVEVDAPVYDADPYIRPTFTIPIGSTGLALDRYVLGAATTDTFLQDPRSWLVQMSSAWQAAAQATTYRWPDLSDLAGYSPLFELEAAVPIHCTTARVGTSAADLVDGRREQTSVQLDTL